MMEAGQFEMEMKFRVTDPGRLRDQLKVLGAEFCGREMESDQYFRSPVRDFAVSGEALRVRSVGDEQILTYKGPRLEGPAKIRKELEIGVHPISGTMMELLTFLGFEGLTEIRKWRETYTLGEQKSEKDDHPMTICLDDAEGLGCFAEIEILAPIHAKEEAIRRIQELAGKLELNDREDRSYLRMHLEKNR